MSKESIKKIKNSIRNGSKAADVIFVVLLVAFPFLHVNYGVDAGDTGYNLLNFATFPHMNRTWAVSTLLANLTGHVFTKLPAGDTVLGVNIYCTLLFGAFMVAFFILLRKFYPGWVVFLGLFLAEGFCWCPRVILYHYMSYYLFGLGTLLLLHAIEKEKKGLYIAAGTVLALNVFVRFPNIVESAMILVLFYYGIREKKHIWKEFLYCFVSYLAVLILGILIVEIAFGRGSFTGMIQSLFGMTKEATSYTPKSMLVKIFGDYLDYFRYFAPFVILGLIAAIPMILLRQIWSKALVAVLAGMCFGVMVRLYYKWNVFNFNYVDYRSIFAWGTFFLMIAIVLGIAGLFRKNYPLRRRLLGVAVILLAFITPIGSNNGLYTAFNNLFLVAVFVLGELVYDPKGSIFEKKKTSEIIPVWWGTFALRCVALMVCGVTLIQGTFFGISFIYGDESFVNGDFVTISGNDVVSGICTGKTNGLGIYGLNEFLKENNLKNQSTICYGMIPGIYYYCEEECAISHSWADLDSFPYEEMKADLEKLQNEPDSLPLFIGSKRLAGILDEEQEDGGEEGGQRPDQKTEMLAKFLASNGYEEVYRNEDYFVALPKAKD